MQRAQETNDAPDGYRDTLYRSLSEAPRFYGVPQRITVFEFVVCGYLSFLWWPFSIMGVLVHLLVAWATRKDSELLLMVGESLSYHRVYEGSEGGGDS